jgi:hypothetical protein
MPEPRPSATVARLEALAATNDARSYLEIGVEKGATFLNATFFELRHGVDPRFRFDVRDYESASVRFFEMTSDAFFTRSDAKQNYDVIFLDGRHTFEQTFRDFCSTQAHAHDRTIWVIDDVQPSDIFAAHHDMHTAYKFREEHGLEGNRWMGDVYKVVFAIHDFFPNLSYRTSTRNNAQTIVTRRPRTAFKPLYDNLERISRMTYYDLMEHRDYMNLATDDDIVAWLHGA